MIDMISHGLDRVLLMHGVDGQMNLFLLDCFVIDVKQALKLG
jgi:hypothetical protein